MPDRNSSGFAQGNGIIAAAIVLAALIVSWSLPDTPRYQIAGSGSMVVRLDTDSGALIACDARACRRIEAPDRAKTIGALQVQFGEGNEAAEQKQLPAGNRQ
jgi:hypothetical protein